MKTIKVNIYTAFILFFSIAVIFFACAKTNPVRQDPVPQLVTASISGQVTDLNSAPVSNATVTAGGSVTTTNSNGKFTIQNAQLDKDAGYVSVAVAGYFNGSRTFVVNTSAENFVEIQLIPKNVSGNFTAGSGGNINVSGGGTVNFIAGNVVKISNGAAYSGNVSVATFYLNPEDKNFKKFMPGDLRGISSNNKQGVLTVFSMASVELDDASGERLQLAAGAGNTATISLPIPATILASAPATLPLWYFDEGSGFWKQEGTAAKQGSSYVGTVSHFSFWTAGELGQSIEFSATFTLDTSGIPYANKLVTLSRVDSTTINSFTDSTGTVRGLVPANETLNMKLFNDCGEPVLIELIGPFSGNTDLGIIQVENGACYTTDTSQYFNLSFNGKTYTWLSYHITEGFEAGSHTFLLGGNPGDTTSTSLEGLIFGGVPFAGSYPMALYMTVNGAPLYQAGGMSFDPSYPYPTTVVTKFDAIGGYIEGTISGWIKTFPSIATADSFPVSGNYKVKRIQ